MIKLRARRRHYGKADEIATTVAYLAAAVAARPPAGRLSPGRNPRVNPD